MILLLQDYLQQHHTLQLLPFFASLHSEELRIHGQFPGVSEFQTSALAS
jgi:hypothetical protein